MNKKKAVLVVLVSILVFILVYSPHWNYHFPLYVDEWHHITEAIKLGHGEYQRMGQTGWGAIMGYEVGFHAILLGVSKFVNLVTAYQYFPAIWAVISVLVLFFVVYRKTENYMISIFSMLFFASLKSNVNIGGLWFFTPLTFAIPFIFLYIYFFTEGIEKRQKKPILISLAIMIPLLCVHAVSVLFAVPFLLIYSLFHFDYLKKEYKFFSIFLILILAGVLFYAYMTNISLADSLTRLFKDIQFKYGWGVLERNNSPLELYSLAGYALALAGVFAIILQKKQRKFLAYVLWPLTLIISIAIFKIWKVSFLSPYQRNMYYLALSLPFLSALGLNYVLGSIKIKRKTLETSARVALIILVFVLTFYNYSYISKPLGLYRPINDADYNALLFLSNLPDGKVAASPYISEAIYPVAGKTPVGTLFFYGNKSISNSFFNAKTCLQKQKIATDNKIRYVLSRTKINCNWKPVYSKGDYIYEFRF